MATRTSRIDVKYLQILNWGLLVVGAMMSLVLVVVTLIMALYREEAAAVGGSFTGVASTTAMFALFALAAALAVWGMHRRFAWRWLAEGGLIAALVVLIQFLRGLTS